MKALVLALTILQVLCAGFAVYAAAMAYVELRRFIKDCRKP